MRRERLGDRGFALLDALLAGSILVVGVLSLVQLFALATRANTVAAHITFATILAAQKLEELRSAPWSEASGEDHVDGYTRRWSALPFAPDPLHAMVLDVRVAPGGVHLLTLRARGGP